MAPGGVCFPRAGGHDRAVHGPDGTRQVQAISFGEILHIIPISSGRVKDICLPRNVVIQSCTRNSAWLCCLALFLAACSSTPSISEYATDLKCPDCPELPVSRVIDGDTFQSPAGNVRLFGVDTPERGERCFRQATGGLRQLARGSVRVESGPRPRDPGGRLLYYVYTMRGNSIDEILVREGLARAWTRDGQHRDALARLERSAKSSRSGCLW